MRKLLLTAKAAGILFAIAGGGCMPRRTGEYAAFGAIDLDPWGALLKVLAILAAVAGAVYLIAKRV